MKRLTPLFLLLGTLAGAQTTTINGSDKVNDSRIGISSIAATATTATNTAMPGNATICAKLPCARVLIPPNIVAAMPVPGSFSRFFDTTTKAMSGKTIVFYGNSTVQIANEMFTELATYASTGQVLAGLTVTPVVLDGGGLVVTAGNIYNKGLVGGTLVGALADNTLYNLCANPTPDLIVIRGNLINDVRTGTTSLDQARSLIRRMLDRVTGCAPQADILLTTENSLLSTDPTGMGQIVPLSSAQAYSTILHDAVMSFAGAYPQVTVYDMQSALYGLTAQATTALMKDELHPSPVGRTAEADLIAGVLSVSRDAPSNAPSCRVGTVNRIVSPSDITNAAWQGAGAALTKDAAMQFTVLASNGSALVQVVPVTPRTCLTFSFQAKAGTLALPKYAVYDQSHASFIVPSTSYAHLINSSTFSTITIPFTVPAGATEVAVYVDSNSTSTGTTFVQNMTVQ